jgi:ComF family protein
VGSRDSALRPLIDAYKFERARAVHGVLVDMLDKTLPTLPSDVQVVPIPTITPHRRTRGYGHVELVAKRFADRRGLAYTEIVQRRHNHVQRGLGRRERIAQAKETYMVTTPAKGTYLLLDDVYTTGATLEYATRALRAAGATDVWVAALSRQTLEK